MFLTICDRKHVTTHFFSTIPLISISIFMELFNNHLLKLNKQKIINFLQFMKASQQIV